MGEDSSAYVLEKVSIEGDSDDEYKYEEVVIESDSEEEEENDDLETVLKAQKKPEIIKKGAKGIPGPPSSSLSSHPPSSSLSLSSPSLSSPSLSSRKAEVVDDFIRNFLVKSRFDRTLDIFQTEWYEKVAKGQIKEEDAMQVPDVYAQHNDLESINISLRNDLDQWQSLAGKLRENVAKLRKDRDFHKMHHKRLTQEKNKLISDLKKVHKKVDDSLAPEISTWKTKYESLYREYNLAKIERDKYAKKIAEYESGAARVAEPPTRSKPPEKQSKEKGVPKRTETAKSKRAAPTTNEKDSELPNDDRVNPFAHATTESPDITGFISMKVHNAHSAPITSLSMHATKSICVSTSDDGSWKMWSLPDCQLIMSGEGHKDWLSDSDFHPKGTMLVTSSGDNTVKIWDFANSCCSTTFTDHSSSVWSCAFHDSGDFVASGSLDHTAKLWDLHSLRCRQTLRGHMDSVNSVEFLPYTNHLATCSGDKTVSLWDVRTGLCVQTFFGHGNSCNNVTFNAKGDTLASSDADGIVKLWDVRTVSERLTIDMGPFPANHVTFDPSSTFLVVPSDSHIVKVYNIVENKFVTDFRGHDDAVNAVIFDPYSRYLVSASSDGIMHIWAPR